MKREQMRQEWAWTVQALFALTVVMWVAGCSREKAEGTEQAPVTAEHAGVQGVASVSTAPLVRRSVTGEVFAVETPLEFTREVLSNSLPVMVMFHSRTSAPSVMMLPTLHRMAREYRGRVCVVEVDLSKAALRPLEAQYTVLSVPTFVFFREGREQHRLVGTTKPERLTFMMETKLLAPGTIPRFRK